jgi:hypothetical protein
MSAPEGLSAFHCSILPFLPLHREDGNIIIDSKGRAAYMFSIQRYVIAPARKREDDICLMSVFLTNGGHTNTTATIFHYKYA